MTHPDTISNMLNAFVTRGVVVGVSPTGKLQVRQSLLLTPEERAWLGANAGAVITHLKDALIGSALVAPSGEAPWDRRAAIKLMNDADAIVEQLGISGHHPDVRDAAARVASAYATRDLEIVRFAVAEFKLLVRKLAHRTVEKQPERQ